MEKIESGNIKLKDEWKVLRGLEILEYRKIIISFLDNFLGNKITKYFRIQRRIVYSNFIEIFIRKIIKNKQLKEKIFLILVFIKIFKNKKRYIGDNLLKYL